MQTIKIVDTNVILVANGQHENVEPDCVSTCALALQDLMKNGKLALDGGYLILNEYQNKTQPKKGNRPGDAFVKWALQNSGNPTRCDQVELQAHATRKFESFPDHVDLQNFDEPDRKFVAVSMAHPDHPEILQAADSKWLDWAPALKENQVLVNFLCIRDVKKFHKRKFGK
jgi:hypothetical protein